MNPLNLKVILVGSETVGKTTLLHRFTENEFSRNTTSTVSAAFRCKLCQYKQYRVTLGIWDTAGQRKFDNTVFYKRAKVALVCYDITNSKSFQNLDRYIELVRKEAEPNCLFAVIGTKYDLADRNRRQVPFDKAKKYAKEVGAAFALETSAKSGFQVNDVFHRVISSYVDTYLEGSLPSSPHQRTSSGSSFSPSSPEQQIPSALLDRKDPFDSGAQDQSFMDHSSLENSGASFHNLKTPLLENGQRERTVKTTVCTCRFPCIIL